MLVYSVQRLKSFFVRCCLYIKNQRNTISACLDRYLDGRLDVHNGAAFYMTNEDETFGTVHPSDKMISGFAALILGLTFSLS